MKTTLRFAGLCVAIFLLASFAIAFHRRTLDRAQQENASLRQQIDVLMAQSEQLGAEKARLASALAAGRTTMETPLPQETSREVLRLRGEVGRLRLQDRDIEQGRREQMQAAQMKLRNAEVELARLTTAHSEKLVSSAELSIARFTVQLLRAEARGDTAGAAQVRLQQAEEELARATELHSQFLISQTEFDQAVRKVESLRAGGR